MVLDNVTQSTDTFVKLAAFLDPDIFRDRYLDMFDGVSVPNSFEDEIAEP